MDNRDICPWFCSCSLVLEVHETNNNNIQRCLDVSCEAAAPLISLSNSLLLNQQINKPTRLSNILDLIFCPDELIKSISVADTKDLSIRSSYPNDQYSYPNDPHKTKLYFKPSPKYF